MGELSLYDGWKKQQTHFQPKQDSGVCGAATEEMDPGGFRSWSTGAEKNTETHPKMAQGHARTYTQPVAFPVSNSLLGGKVR